MPAKMCVASLAVTMTVWASTASAQVETLRAREWLSLRRRRRSRPDARADARSRRHESHGGRPGRMGSRRHRGCVERDAPSATSSWASRIAQRGRLADALREFDAAIAERPNASDVQLLRALTLEAMRTTRGCGSRFRRRVGTADRSDPVKAYYVATRAGCERGRPRAGARAADRRLPPGRRSQPAADDPSVPGARRDSR